MRPLPFFPINALPTKEQTIWLNEAGWQPVSFSPTSQIVPVILLHSPVLCGEEFIRPCHVWKRFYKKHAPDTKIIETGIVTRPSEQLNYLDWYALPPNFNDLVERSLPATHWTPITSSSGRPLEQVWQTFNNGHNDDGFAAYFSWSKQTIDTVAWRLLTDGESYLPRAQERLEDADFLSFYHMILQKWRQYLPLLCTAPFAHLLSRIDTHVSGAAQGWESVNFSMIDQVLSRMITLQNHFKQANTLLNELSPFFKDN